MAFPSVPTGGRQVAGKGRTFLGNLGELSLPSHAVRCPFSNEFLRCASVFFSGMRKNGSLLLNMWFISMWKKCATSPVVFFCFVLNGSLWTSHVGFSFWVAFS